ncbi:Cytochrome P450 2J2 [Camelus dromedarius]|uniref:Cytochrome P450 2J2 n=1 Tax=Camelus dromedarius TaxID=9838 RepID=A0A5N4DBW5_CAMDR|nr:Cytochrome P450 2J2 [Camelus dromedarius]
MLGSLGSLAAALWGVLSLRTLLLGAIAFLFFADFIRKRRPKNYPPGPLRLPFVGHLLHLDFENVHLSLQRMCIFNGDCFAIFQFVKKYGNVFRLEVGDFSSVVITGLPLIKEAFVHQGQNFANRPVTPFIERVFKNKGKCVK